MNPAPIPSRGHPAMATLPGFTLAEVLFAMAIFSFAVLILVGALPNGLGAMRDARQQAAESRAVIHLTAVYQAELDRTTPATFTAVITPLQQPSRFHFDANGDPVRGGSESQNDTAFAILAELLPAVELPGESNPSPFIRRLDLAISTDWRNAASFTRPNTHHRRVVPLTLRTPLDPSAPAPTGGGSEAPPPSNAP